LEATINQPLLGYKKDGYGVIFILDQFGRIYYNSDWLVVGALFFMNRFIQKIAVTILACLLALNLTAGATVDAAACPPLLCGSGPMDMGHHDGMINFTLPMPEGCCEDCNDVFCNLMKDPLQDAHVVNPSPYQGHCYPAILATLDAIGQSGIRAPVSESRHRLIVSGSSGPIPLYLEHLSLII
jgi:hypothetical protein